MTGFFQELRRRKIYRVAAAYGAAATVFLAWAWPGWSLRLLILVVLTELPTALIWPGHSGSRPRQSSER